MSVVVDHDDAAADDLVVEVIEADPGGLVPVTVEPEERDRAELRGVARHGVLEPTLVVTEQVSWVREHLLHELAVLVERPDALAHRTQLAATCARVVDRALVVDGDVRLRQSFEAIEEVQLTRRRGAA